MRIDSLQCTNFRNLLSTKLQFSQGVNFFYGCNGAGKTSLLEALGYLGLGRSFRTSVHSRVVHYGADSFSIFGQIFYQGEIIPVGLERGLPSRSRIRIAGEEIKKITTLVEMLPLQIITSDSHALLSMGAEYRRRFMNWGLFHVEQSFVVCWRKLQRVLKQRNILLRAPILDKKQLHGWDIEFAKLTQEVSAMQEGYLSQLLPLVNSIWQKFINSKHLSVEMEFFLGWPKKYDILTALSNSLEADLKYGYTRIGPHRADLLLRVNKCPVQDVLSRGQQKLLVYSLKLAQGLLLKQQVQKHCVYLFDDLSAELDQGKCELLSNLLYELQAQIFITAINRRPMLEWFHGGAAQMFHVEHGVVHSQET